MADWDGEVQFFFFLKLDVSVPSVNLLQEVRKKSVVEVWKKEGYMEVT